MKDKIYRFAYTRLLSFWTNKDMKKFFERKRSTRFKSFKKRKPKMKKLLSLPVVVLFMIGCKEEKKDYRKPTFAGQDTIIAMPKYGRQLGYDSIQLIQYDSVLEANFCYFNNYQFKRDTVYTTDTAYRQYWTGVNISPDLIILSRSKTGVTMRDGYVDMTKPDWNLDHITIDSFQIKITKIKSPTKSIKIDKGLKPSPKEFEDIKIDVRTINQTGGQTAVEINN